MERKAILLHGTGAHPEVVWLPSPRNRLTERGYAVEAPHYPGFNVEPIATFLPKVSANHAFDENTVLIGHSGGAALLLAILEHIEPRVDQAILVARLLHAAERGGRARPSGGIRLGRDTRERQRHLLPQLARRPVRL